MSRKHTLIKGTFILTATGLITRFMGFFYRIFLSHTFGEEGVGLYQLIFPIYALCFSFTAAGIETALSRLVAKRLACGQKKEARELLHTSLIFTVPQWEVSMYHYGFWGDYRSRHCGMHPL